MELGKNPEPVRKLVDVLLGLLSAEQQPVRHWRYTLMAQAMLMFLLPPVDAATAEVMFFPHILQLRCKQEAFVLCSTHFFLIDCHTFVKKSSIECQQYIYLCSGMNRQSRGTSWA